MQIINSFETMQHICRQHKKEGKSIGFVPTMGFLHAGHASLLAISAHQNQITGLSICVNPTQFNQSSDYEHYAIDIEHDLVIAQKNQVDYVFIPQKNELYADEYVYQVQEQKNSFLLEGEFRPGHFTGVLTIVLKLLNKRVDWDSAHYDADALGWPYVVPGYGQDGAPDDERKYIYDTTKIGLSSAAHLFGDHLRGAERAAVLEYLKTI